MFALIQLVRKVFKQLKSDLTPAQLAVGVFLGALLGLTPFGLHSVLLFFLALLFNCSMASFLIVGALLKPAGLLLAGPAFRLGVSLLDGGGAYASIIRAVSEAPFLAWLGYERYIVAGAYLIALPLALLAALAVRFGVARYRTSYAQKMEQTALYQKAKKNAASRFMLHLLVGKEKEFEEKKKRFILLRPFRAYMAVAIPVVCIALSVGGGLYAQTAIQDVAAGAAGRALGVKVTFDKVDYSFFGQRLTFQNFQLPDPDKPTENMVRIGGFEGDLGFVSLLSKRLHVETLAVRDVALRVARNEDGTLNVTNLPAARPDPEAPPGEQAAWQKFLQWLHEKGKDVDWAEVWRKYQEYRAKKKEAREKEPRTPPPPPAFDADLRWSPERSTPFLRVDKLELRNLALNVSERSGKAALPPVTHVDVLGTELSTQPGWNGRAMEVAGAGKLAEGASGTIKFRFTVLPPKTEGEIALDGAPLTDYRELYEKTLPVRVEKGKASLAVGGTTLSGAIDSGANLRIDGLQVAMKPGETKILGLDPELSGYAVQGINAYGEKLPVVAGVAITGPLSDPSVQGRLPFLEVARKGLEMLGRKELEARLGREVDQLKKLGTEKLVPLEGDFKKTQEALLKGDVSAVQEALKKGELDAKSLPDAKKELEEKKGELDKLKDLFKKKEK